MQQPQAANLPHTQKMKVISSLSYWQRHQLKQVKCYFRLSTEDQGAGDLKASWLHHSPTPLPVGKILTKVSSAALHNILKTNKVSGAELNLLLEGSNSRTFCCCRAQLPPLLPHLTEAEQLFLYPLAIKTKTIYPIVS